MPHSLFSLSINALGAFNQVCCLAGALLCLAIGGLLLGNALYWRLHAERVTGTITGLREIGGFYYTVYTYTLATGQTVEATSDSGSSSSAGNETGRTLSLLVFRSHPEQARRAGNYIFEIIGIFFAAPGVLFLYLACTAWPVTKLTFVVLTAMGAYAIVRLHRIVMPKEKIKPIMKLFDHTQWRDTLAQMTSNADKMKGLPIRRMEDIPVSPEQKSQMTQQVKSGKKIGVFLAVLGPLLMVGGIFSGHEMLQLTREGARTPGTVVGLQSEWSNHSNVYHAIVDFHDMSGNPIHFKDRTGTNPPMYRPGDAVTVLYLPEKPEKSATIDRGVWNWLSPVLLFVLGVATFLGGCSLARQKPPTS